MIAYALHTVSEGLEMVAKTVGFAIADEDRELLDALVGHFGKGNRSEFLRVAIRRLNRDMLSERMQHVQARAREELAGREVSRLEVTALVKRVLRGSE